MLQAGFRSLASQGCGKAINRPCMQTQHLQALVRQPARWLASGYDLNNNESSVRCSAAGNTASNAAIDRAAHNQTQAQFFNRPDIVKAFTESIPDDIQERMRQIINAIPGLSESSRVIDVGSGTGCLIPYLQARGVQDILAVDVSAAPLQQIAAKYSKDLDNLGNTAGVRIWVGDVMDLPNYLGWAADVFIFNAVFGNLHSPKAALCKAALQIKPGGYIVISHPLGRAWHAQLANDMPHIVPHHLPDRQALQDMIQGLPLQIIDFKDEAELYLAVLQVPPRYTFPGAPITMTSKVVVGFGRGSRQLGTPTANLDPAPLQHQLDTMQRGVYYGWAQLVADPSEGFSEADLEVHKMVMNVGRRPTVNTGDEAPTVEVHVMHTFSGDFYGKEMRAVALGYIRPEMKFPGGLPELVNRIKLDIAIGKNQLDAQENQEFKSLLS